MQSKFSRNTLSKLWDAEREDAFMEVLQFTKANCRDCYKCVRECPVKSIRVKDHQAQIIREDCVLCGRCVQVCPQNAKDVRDDVPLVKEKIASGRKVIATLAPSFIAAFDAAGFRPMAEAMKKLGFYEVFETAVGANIVKTRYEQMIEEGKELIISSCCHSITRLIQRYHPECLQYYADVVSPMEAHAKLIKQQYPDASIVFVGPCISKKDEVEQYCEGDVDLTITFDELENWFADEGITFDNQDTDDSRFRSRFFPEPGGVIKSMHRRSDFHYIAIDGVERCRAALDEIAAGGLMGYFIEMNACEGACINGPGMPKKRRGHIMARVMVEQAAEGSKDYDVQHDLDLSKVMLPEIHRDNIPGEAEIQKILALTGKHGPEDMLDCGACGYSTCREKAIAVWQGKAELEMCLHYMKERAESFSDQVFESSPNGIIAVDDQFVIRQINKEALNMLSIPDDVEAVGSDFGEYYDILELLNVMETGENIINMRGHLDRSDLYVDRTVMFDKEHSNFLIFLKNIDAVVKAEDAAAELRRETIRITDQVVDKQMRAVQEIASLLGETTAETKVALTMLKKSML